MEKASRGLGYVFQQPCLSRVPQSKPLPLFLSELRGNRLVPLGRSEDKPIAEPMFFEAACDGLKRIIFAIVEGSNEKPVLKLISSDDDGHEFREIGRLSLRDMPAQLSVALYPAGAIVALSTQRGEFVEVEGIQVSF